MSETVTNRFLRKALGNLEDIDEIYGELKYSVLIIPLKEDKYPTVKRNGKEMIPVFTDIHEYQKQNLDEDFRPSAYYFNCYLELLEAGSPDLVINPKSENFIITDKILDVMETDYMFHLDYQPFTTREIKEMYLSLDNSKILQFISADNMDLDELMEILMSSDLLTLISSKEPLDLIDDAGIYGCFCPTSFQVIDNFALIFSNHLKGLNNGNSYSQFVNLSQFIDEMLKNDISGILLDYSIVIPRKFLIDYMKNFNCPSLDDYSMYAFSLGENDEQ